MEALWSVVAVAFVLTVLGTGGYGVFKLFGSRNCGRQLHTR
jgi:hypothetical protein